MGKTRTGVIGPVLAGLAVFGMLLCAQPLPAQTPASKPHVRLAPRVLVEVDVETPLIIQVGPTEALPANSYVQLRGLPDSATLNEGHSISPGTWAVPLRSLPNLTVQAPQSAAGTTEFTVRIVSLEGQMLAEVKSSMIVAAAYVIGQRSASAESAPRIVQPPTPAVPPAPPAAAPATSAIVQRPPGRSKLAAAPLAIPAPQAAPAPSATARPVPVPPTAAPAPAPAPAQSQLPADERVRLERFVSLGNRHLATGNIAAAREFYRKAAEGGLADGALLLATTYDPVELDAIKVQGLSPDLAEARRWYERARALGAAGIDARLARLGAR